MTFREILSRIVDDTPGALAAAIMSRDGIPVDEYSAADNTIDLSAVAVEFERVLDQAAKVAGSVFEGEEGVLEELVIGTRGPQLLFHPIDGEYFIVVALSHSGLLGKARYMVRHVLRNVQEEL